MFDDTLSTSDKNPVVESPHEEVTPVPQRKYRIKVMRGLSNLSGRDEGLPTKDL